MTFPLYLTLSDSPGGDSSEKTYRIDGTLPLRVSKKSASFAMAGGREISLFSGYNQKENRHTNYCLLLLKQLYEENPRFLAEALDGITGGEGDSVIGVQFRQQEQHSSTIPDGVIKQQPFTLFVETKNFDWFYDD